MYMEQADKWNTDVDSRNKERKRREFEKAQAEWIQKYGPLPVQNPGSSVLPKASLQSLRGQPSTTQIRATPSRPSQATGNRPPQPSASRVNLAGGSRPIQASPSRANQLQSAASKPSFSQEPLAGPVYGPALPTASRESISRGRNSTAPPPPVPNYDNRSYNNNNDTLNNTTTNVLANIITSLLPLVNDLAPGCGNTCGNSCANRCGNSYARPCYKPPMACPRPTTFCDDDDVYVGMPMTSDPCCLQQILGIPQPPQDNRCTKKKGKRRRRGCPNDDKDIVLTVCACPANPPAPAPAISPPPDPPKEPSIDELPISPLRSFLRPTPGQAKKPAAAAPPANKPVQGMLSRQIAGKSKYLFSSRASSRFSDHPSRHDDYDDDLDDYYRALEATRRQEDDFEPAERRHTERPHHSTRPPFSFAERWGERESEDRESSSRRLAPRKVLFSSNRRKPTILRHVDYIDDDDDGGDDNDDENYQVGNVDSERDRERLLREDDSQPTKFNSGTSGRRDESRRRQLPDRIMYSRPVRDSNSNRRSHRHK